MWLIIICLFQFFFIIQCNFGGCPLMDDQLPKAQNISFCKQYLNSSCCFINSSVVAEKNIQQSLIPVFGNNNCSENLVNFMCAWICGPMQYNITTSIKDPNGYVNLTVYVDISFAEELYNSCGDVCLPFGGGITVFQQYSSATDFILQFSSNNDPNYNASQSNSYINYKIGTSPNGMNINSQLISLEPYKASGCSRTVTTTTTTNQSNDYYSTICNFMLTLFLMKFFI
jgi:hypothetical protein